MSEAAKFAPAFLSTFSELEHHMKHAVPAETAFGAPGSVPDRGEGAFDWVRRSDAGSALAGAFGQDGVDAIPDIPVDDGVVLARIAVALVDRLTDIGPVVQQAIQVLLVDPVTARRADTAFRDLAGQFRARADLEKAREDPAGRR